MKHIIRRYIIKKEAYSTEISRKLIELERFQLTTSNISCSGLWVNAQYHGYADVYSVSVIKSEATLSQPD